MAIQFKVRQINSKLNNPETPKPVFFASTKQVGRVNIYTLADDISGRCTLHSADIIAVLEAMSDAMIHYLSLGYGVDLGRLGSVYTTIRSKATGVAKDFTIGNIKGISVRFAPSLKIKEAMKRVSYNGEVSLPAGTPAAGGGTGTPSAPGVGE